MKPLLIFRIHNYNRVSHGALIGSCDKFLFKDFQVKLWESDKEVPDINSNERIMCIYSFMFPHVKQVEIEINELKKKFPDRITFVAGGAQASADPESLIEIGFDHVVKGEAENYFRKMLIEWKEDDLKSGIKEIRDDIVDLNSYNGFSGIVGYLPPIEITRGCTFGCMYCGVPRLTRGMIRHRSVDKIIEIVKEYKKIKTGKKRIKFLSPNAFSYKSNGIEPNIDALAELIRKVKETGINEVHLGSFPSEVRPDFVTDRLMKIIGKELSNKTIVMGVQSGSDDMLIKMNRGHTLTQAIEAIRLIRKYGFTPHIDFIIGNPDETPQDQKLLIKFMKNMIELYKIRVHMHVFMPLPGTPWANELPATIAPEVKEELIALTNKGHLDGWWQNQIGYGRKVAR